MRPDSGNALMGVLAVELSKTVVLVILEQSLEPNSPRGEPENRIVHAESWGAGVFLTASVYYSMAAPKVRGCLVLSLRAQHRPYRRQSFIGL